jgi:hypothetical protein
MKVRVGVIGGGFGELSSSARNLEKWKGPTGCGATRTDASPKHRSLSDEGAYGLQKMIDEEDLDAATIATRIISISDGSTPRERQAAVSWKSRWTQDWQDAYHGGLGSQKTCCFR